MFLEAMICRYCEVRSDFVNAHVIPAGFFRRLSADDPEPLRVVLNDENEYPRRAPLGVYDQKLLCTVCEPQFGSWDHYAQELLSDLPPGQTIIEDGQIVGFELRDHWHYELLKLFFISLIWRASASTHNFYRRIRLGPYEEKAKQMLDACDAGSPQEFAVLLGRFIEPGARILLDPHEDRCDGVNFCRFYLSGYVAYIKVDRRPAPDWMTPLLLMPDAPLKIVARSLKQSKELPLLRSFLARHRKRASH